MKVLGIGIDTEEHSRFNLDDLNLISKILSEEELITYNSIRSEKRKKEFLSSRFCLKEALYKVGVRLKMKDITINKTENNKPYVNLSDNYIYEMSLTHSNNISIAVVIKLERENE